MATAIVTALDQSRMRQSRELDESQSLNQFAHRKCIQRWCNKKGDITCEIWSQVYSSNYILPPRAAVLRLWPLILEYDDYSVANRSLACIRSVAIILMLILLIRQVLMVTRDFGMVQESSTFFNAFGADQIDGKDSKELKARSSFFNWWYLGLCGGPTAAFLFLNYILDSINWGLGFGIPCISMVVALVVFLIGTRTYRYTIKGHNNNPFLRIAKGCQVQKVSEVIKPHPPEWDSGKLRELVGQEEANSILTIPIPVMNQDDALVWHHTKTGNFEVRSGYQFLRRELQSRAAFGASSSAQPTGKFWNLIWSLPVPPKVRNFWWRVCTNSLATKENLHHRHCAPSPACPICGSCSESIEHLLFQCAWTRPVWFGCDLGYLSGFNSSSSAIQWTQEVLESCQNDRPRKESLGKAATVGWSLWKARNAWVFNQSEVDPMQVIRQASFLWREGSSVVALSDSPPVSLQSLACTNGFRGGSVQDQ
ncbi:Protein NRT1/ PTR FAMILY 5.10 [Camellia lanceoleosa]|uniref:Protein NRT1/ PTR FAMILY 5.10 n=1 Tax=Camellia lanceoleosa TaxID=1840588 RepID=A0ACC0IWW4_9ERIC|nr:Protein NRT1/ PTR FAMILY 5.10 [Camellia lanceoleosa]